MQKPLESKKYSFKGVEGLSEKMLAEHIKLYEGYVKKTIEMRGKIVEADKSEANGVFSYIGELKRQETFAVNGVKLHEVYFSELAEGVKLDGAILNMITEDFGSFEAWQADLIATGMSARGWAILAFDFHDNRLHNYGADAHNVGAVWGAIPLVALDVYEHAYFMDYGVSRKDYIATFFKNLNWKKVNEIVEEFELTKRHRV